MRPDTGSRFDALDLGPLTGRGGLASRLRLIPTNARFVVGGTVALVLVVLPSVALVVMISGGHTEDGGLLLVLGLLVAAGLYTVADVLLKAGGPALVRRFAAINGLRYLAGEPASHYQGSRFADGSHVVDLAVRSEPEPVIEVGDLFPVTTLRSSEQTARSGTAYLRVVLDGTLPSASGTARRIVDPVLEEELVALLGPVVVDVASHEVTVYGARGLKPTRKGRLGQALLLAERVATSAGRLAGPDVPETRRGPSGVTIPAPRRPPEPPERGLHPLFLVAGTLGLLLGLPVVFAVVMASLEPVTMGRGWLGTLVVGLMVAVMVAVVSALVRFAITYRRPGARPRGRRIKE